MAMSAAMESDANSGGTSAIPSTSSGFWCRQHNMTAAATAAAKPSPVRTVGRSERSTGSYPSAPNT
jgi:hypothetical protein